MNEEIKKRRDHIRTCLTYSLPAGIKDFEWAKIVDIVEGLIEQGQKCCLHCSHKTSLREELK